MLQRISSRLSPAMFSLLCSAGIGLSACSFQIGPRGPDPGTESEASSNAGVAAPSASASAEAPAAADPCREKAREKVAKRKAEGADLLAAIEKARSAPTRHARLEALFALRAPKEPESWDERIFYALTGAPFELEMAIHEELKDHEAAWANIAFYAKDPHFALRPLGTEELEAKVACLRFGGGWGAAEGEIKAARGPLERARGLRMVPELPRLTWDPADKGTLEMNKVYRVGGGPGKIGYVGSNSVTVEVKGVKKDGAGAVVDFQIEHDADFTISCRPRYEGIFRVGESCDYGKAWGRRKITVRFPEVPPTGVEAGDRIAFFATVKTVGAEKRTETPREKVRAQALELDGIVVHALLRDKKVLFAIPSRAQD